MNSECKFLWGEWRTRSYQVPCLLYLMHDAGLITCFPATETSFIIGWHNELCILTYFLSFQFKCIIFPLNWCTVSAFFNFLFLTAEKSLHLAVPTASVLCCNRISILEIDNNYPFRRSTLFQKKLYQRQNTIVGFVRPTFCILCRYWVSLPV